jgi:branched-chain amino acid aminotransferase
MPILTRYILGETLCDDDRLIISAQNRAMRYGDGIFETILVRDAAPMALQMHIQRLLRGAKILGFAPLEADLNLQIQALVEKLLIGQGRGSLGRMRITVFRADGGTYLPSTDAIQIYGEIQPLQDDPWELQPPKRIMINNDFPIAHTILSAAKSLNALPYVLAARQARVLGYDDAILTHVNGELAELTAANLFLVIDNCLITPRLESGCLPGTMRDRAIEAARMLSLPYRETGVFAQEVHRASEAFYTNAIQGIQPIASIASSRYAAQEFPYMTQIRAMIATR